MTAAPDGNTAPLYPTFIHQRVELARQGQNPAVVCRMESGWVVFSDIQVLNGYCLLMPDPVVADLNALTIPQREVFLREMSVVGDALLEVLGAARINYEILGNSEKALHAHIIPRYEAEPDDVRRAPVWFYDLSKAPRFDVRTYGGLVERVRVAIEKRVKKA